LGGLLVIGGFLCIIHPLGIVFDGISPRRAIPVLRAVSDSVTPRNIATAAGGFLLAVVTTVIRSDPRRPEVAAAYAASL
jgi:hypothetical protein